LIYLAGPLFFEAERRFNLGLAERLEAIGFDVLLPQRDGVEREKSPYDAMTSEERRQAMFHLDRSTILDSDVFLFVLDGRVPDEGACGARHRLLPEAPTERRKAPSRAPY
jgi:nucleoside 2-deoxyribosyltransferase